MNSKEIKIYGLGKKGYNITTQKRILSNTTILGKLYNKHNYNDDIELQKILQFISKYDLITLLGLIKEKPIVIKFNNNNSIINEISINNELKKNKLEGFLYFIDYFTCSINKKLYNDKYHNNLSKLQLCDKKKISPENYIIISDYYKNESLKNYLNKYMKKKNIQFIDKNKKLIKLLYKITIQIIDYITTAYNKIGFIHNDLFSQNILLDNNLNAIIIDYELANLDTNKEDFYTSHQDIYRFIEKLQIFFINKEIIKKYSNIIRQLFIKEEENNDYTNSFVKVLKENIKQLFNEYLKNFT
jgi:serine/threonine protein kinase